MKRIILLLLIAAPMLLMAQGKARWLEKTHNFGAFDENNGKAVCYMKFVNDGNEPVIIKQVHVTCGCTSPSFDRQPIAPGDTGVVALSYDPTGRPGRFEKRVYVDLNTVPSRDTLYIKGSVIGSPATVNDRYPEVAGPVRTRVASIPFGEVTKGRSKSYFFELYNNSTDTVTPEWTNLPQFISVGSAKSKVYPGENQAYTFMLASDKVSEYGLTIDSLTLIPDPEKNPDKRYTLPVMVMVQEDFTRLTPGQMRNAPVIATSTDRITFDSIGKDPVTQTIDVTNKGTDPLVIRRVYSMDKAINVSTSSTKIKKGKNATIKVTVNPAEIDSKVLNGKIIIITNDPTEPLKSVTVVGAINH